MEATPTDDETISVGALIDDLKVRDGRGERRLRGTTRPTADGWVERCANRGARARAMVRRDDGRDVVSRDAPMRASTSRYRSTSETTDETRRERRERRAQSEDVELRLQSIAKLSTIARALGPERTRNELVPFLTERDDESDECLLAIATELTSLIDLVGGAEHAHALLAPLETLITVEETVVRDKAVETACAVGGAMTASGIGKYFVPFIKQLAEGDWFTARVSACGLFATAFERLEESQLELRNGLTTMFRDLCADETPMVRRAAASNLGKIAKGSAQSFIVNELMSMFAALTTDDQDSVRLLVVEDCVALGKLLSAADCANKVVPIVLRFAADKSWRVRYAVAQHIYDMCEIVGGDVASTGLFDAYVDLLGDTEGEVRISSAGKIAEFCALAGATYSAEKILPAVRELANDQSQHVRSSLAATVLGLAPTMGKEMTVEKLLPIFFILLKDEFPDVRLNIISNLEKVNSVIGVEMLSTELLPAIKELAEDEHWRVRLAIIEYIPVLAEQIGTNFLFQKSDESQGGEDLLNSLCLQWLQDAVYSIREAAANNLFRLTEIFGADWALQYIFPRIKQLISSTHYLHRLTVLRALSLLAPAVGQRVALEEILPIIKQASTDAVPNVRFNAAKALVPLAKLIDQATVQSEIRPILIGLQSDPDVDVRYFAEQAMASN